MFAPNYPPHEQKPYTLNASANIWHLCIVVKSAQANKGAWYFIQVAEGSWLSKYRTFHAQTQVTDAYWNLVEFHVNFCHG